MAMFVCLSVCHLLSPKLTFNMSSGTLNPTILVCQHDNSSIVGNIIMKFLWEQDMVGSDEFKTGCIPLHCSASVVMF